eukprot:1187533-Prorocentrum_minimum.AAC.3
MRTIQPYSCTDRRHIRNCKASCSVIPGFCAFCVQVARQVAARSAGYRRLSWFCAVCDHCEYFTCGVTPSRCKMQIKCLQLLEVKVPITTHRRPDTLGYTSFSLSRRPHRLGHLAAREQRNHGRLPLLVIARTKTGRRGGIFPQTIPSETPAEWRKSATGGHWVIVTRIHNDWYLAHTLEVVACSSGASSIRPGVFATDGPVDAKLLQLLYRNSRWKP